MKPVAGQTVTMDSAVGAWQVEFFDPCTSKSLGVSPVIDDGARGWHD